MHVQAGEWQRKCVEGSARWHELGLEGDWKSTRDQRGRSRRFPGLRGSDNARWRGADAVSADHLGSIPTPVINKYIVHNVVLYGLNIDISKYL